MIDRKRNLLSPKYRKCWPMGAFNHSVSVEVLEPVVVGKCQISAGGEEIRASENERVVRHHWSRWNLSGCELRLGSGKEYGIHTFVVLSSAVIFGRVSVVSSSIDRRAISLALCLPGLREETTQAFVARKNVERPGTLDSMSTFCSCSLGVAGHPLSGRSSLAA